MIVPTLSVFGLLVLFVCFHLLNNKHGQGSCPHMIHKMLDMKWVIFLKIRNLLHKWKNNALKGLIPKFICIRNLLFSTEK